MISLKLANSIQMKKIVLMAIFALNIGLAAAQDSKNTSKWRERRNGKHYQMEIESRSTGKTTSNNPHIALKIEGDVQQLAALSLTQKSQFKLNLPINKGTQDINVEPGTYIFKLSHKGLGDKVFAVELKKGDDKTVVLTLK